jgi:hypothetical protein
MSAPPYDIERTRGVCAATGEPLTPGARAVVVIAEVAGDEKLIRFDYADAAWNAGVTLPAGHRVFSKWGRTVPERDDDGKMVLDLDEIMSWFDQANPEDEQATDESADATGNDQAALRYLLALILIRKKKLVLEASEPASRGKPGRLRVRERTTIAQREATGLPPLVTVIEPTIPPERLAKLAEQLAEVIDADA